MKTLLAALSLLVMASASAFAWEYPENPDRFPSLGLNYTGTSETGQYKVLGFSQDIESTSGAFILDTRLPLSNQFTLSVGVGGIAHDVKGKGDMLFNADETNVSGGLFTIGGRYYFNNK